MLGFFKTAVFDDAGLGRLQRVRGMWRGSLALVGSDQTPLALFGSSREPDGAALTAAREIAPAFAAWRPLIEAALFEHYAPYAEAALEEGAEPDLGMPAIRKPHEVWPHVSLHSIAVIRIGGAVVTELAYSVAWDEDHLLGARFQSGRFLELCGSVLPA